MRSHPDRWMSGPLITEEVDLADYEEIYGDMRKKGSIASILRFPADSKMESVVPIGNNAFVSGKGKIGIVGAGNYTSAMIIPCLTKVQARIKYIASAQGLVRQDIGEEGESGERHVGLSKYIERSGGGLGDGHDTP